MEDDTFSPGTVYPYLVEWNNKEKTFQVRKMEENLTLGKLEGGDKDTDYKNYYLGIKYMIYCEDGDGNLVIHSFAVDYRTIYWGFSDTFKGFTEEQKTELFDALKEHPGFNISDDEMKKQYRENVEKMKNGDYNKQLLAEIAFDPKIASEVATTIIDCFDIYRADSTPKILAFSDLHGSVLSYEIGVKMMEKLKKDHEDLITVCEGDAIGRKGRYYTGEKEYDSWNSGKFPELTSIYIIYCIRQLVETAGSNFIYLHGNHDYAIEYPTVMSYTTNNYQLIFSHGMIEPQLLEPDELQQIPEDENDWTRALIYPKSLVGAPGVKIFAFSQESIASKTRNNLFHSNHIEGLPTILENKKDRPENGWDEKAEELGKLQTRDYLSNYFFIMANREGYGYGEVVPRRTIDEMNEALMKLNNFAVGTQVPDNFNPIFTFGHDYSYEVWSYYAYLKQDDDRLSKFPLEGEIWNYNYEWEKVKDARLEKHLMSRVFCVDGVHYIHENNYKDNGIYTKINKYDGNIDDLKGLIDAKEEKDADGAEAEEEIHNEIDTFPASDNTSEEEAHFDSQTLENGNKTAPFKRGVLKIYVEDGSIEGKISRIDDEYRADDKYVGSKAFKLIVVANNGITNIVYEFFFDIQIENISDNRDEIVDVISDTLVKWFTDQNKNRKCLFFIFSPSACTLECSKGVLSCMGKFPDAYFIAMNSPLLDSSDKNEYEEVKQSLAGYNLPDVNNYIELLDLHVADSYSHDGTVFTNPIAVLIQLSNVDILVSKKVNSLNLGVLEHVTLEDSNNGFTLIKYYYGLREIAEGVNIKCPIDSPSIQMTHDSMVNFIKTNFANQVHQDYDLTFIPTDQKQIETLKASLNEPPGMEVNKPITISTADIKRDENAIVNLGRYLYEALNPDSDTVTMDALKDCFFKDESSNPLILTYASSFEDSLSEPDNKTLGKVIERQKSIRNELAETNLLLSRLYSIRSNTQQIGWYVEDEESSSEVSAVSVGSYHDAYENADTAMGGVVTSKKKAIIISIILCAILIIVIVVVVIVTSSNEGFKPSMHQIKP